MSLKSVVRSCYWWCQQFGLDPRRTVRAARELPRFIQDYRQFRRHSADSILIRPSLHDRTAEAGATSDEYFWQDLYVARLICRADPIRHIDVGSRVDGFVAHVASFRDIEIIDIRPITVSIPGIRFRQADLMSLPSDLQECCDSLSCLHALEHFGLGRYGDKIDPAGHEAGFRSLASMLRRDGTFYLSMPVGCERVEYNSHRVVSPRTVLHLAQQTGLRLQNLAWVERHQGVRESTNHEHDLAVLGSRDYALAIFVFRKL